MTPIFLNHGSTLFVECLEARSLCRRCTFRAAIQGLWLGLGPKGVELGPRVGNVMLYPVVYGSGPIWG